MIVFDHDWAFLLLLAPLVLPRLLALVLPPHTMQGEAIKAPMFEVLAGLEQSGTSSDNRILGRNKLQTVVLLISWACLVCAIAKPVWLAEPQFHSKPSRDMLFAVDLSASMLASDFVFDAKPAINRLDGVKLVLNDFVAQRQGDRLGLIVFGSAAYLQVPLSLDQAIFSQLLNETQVGMAGPKTMLGDAIGLAVKHFSSSELKNKVLILLTDGNDSGSLVPPIDAAGIAKDNGIAIHTIAVGNSLAVAEEALDLDTLSAISELTGGVFFHAKTGGDLQKVSSALDQLEPDKVDVLSFRPKNDLFYWPLALALFMQLMLHCFLLFIRINKRVKELVRQGVSDE